MSLNPRYLLSQVMPMSACLALGLAEVEAAKESSPSEIAVWGQPSFHEAWRELPCG